MQHYLAVVFTKRAHVMVKHHHAPEEIFSELWLDFYQVALDGILSHVNNKANYLEDSKITHFQFKGREQ